MLEKNHKKLNVQDTIAAEILLPAYVKIEEGMSVIMTKPLSNQTFQLP
jgi:hypothetical protein